MKHGFMDGVCHSISWPCRETSAPTGIILLSGRWSEAINDAFDAPLYGSKDENETEKERKLLRSGVRRPPDAIRLLTVKAITRE